MLTRIKKIIQLVVRLVQKILVTTFLFILYFLGFGLTLIALFIFKRDFLIKNYKQNESFWKEAADYESEANGSLRQA